MGMDGFLDRGSFLTTSGTGLGATAATEGVAGSVGRSDPNVGRSGVGLGVDAVRELPMQSKAPF